MTDEVDRLSRMVDDLFLLARAQQPDFLRPERLDVNELLRELHRKLATLAPLEWEVGVPAGLWIRGDRQRLTQAVMQLVANAAKHSGGGTVITLGARRDGGHVVLSVADSGAGVAPEDATGIFHRSRRGATGEGGGAGLGLAIVLAIAEAHGGTARLADEGRPGARFELLLPIATGQGGTTTPPPGPRRT